MAVICSALITVETYSKTVDQFTFWVPCCDVRYDFHIKTMFGSSLSPVVCRRVHIIFTLFVRMPIVGYSTYCVVCLWFFLWVFSSSLLPVSLYCRFWIAPSVFSNVYLSMYLYIFCRMFDVHHNCRIKPCSYRFCSTWCVPLVEQSK